MTSVKSAKAARLKPNSGTGTCGPAPTGHHARRTLAVRALAAQLDWLINGVPHWAGDRVAWRLPDGGDRFPECADLSQAQRLVYTTRQYPIAGIAVFTDPDGWREAMQSRLAIVARLRTLRASATQTALLSAEALCVFGDVPGPPSHTLVALAASGRAPQCTFEQLADQAEDTTLPAPARTLAALTLGAMMHEQLRSGTSSFPCPSLSPLIRPAYDRGLRGRLPEQASLIAALFAAGGSPMAARGERLCAGSASNAGPAVRPPFPLPLALLREALLTGDADFGERAERLLSVGELLLHRGADVSRRLVTRRGEITPAFAAPKDRRETAHLRCRREAEKLRKSRAAASQEVADCFEQVLRSSSEAPDLAGLTEQILRFAETLLTLCPPGTLVLETLRNALKQCLTLPVRLRRDFFALACEKDGVIWTLSPNARRGASEADTALAFRKWRQDQWPVESGRLCSLLRIAADAYLVRDAIGLGLYEKSHALVTQWDRDADHLRLYVRVVRQFRPDAPQRKYCPFLGTLRSTLRSFPTGVEARNALHPLISPLLAAARDPDRRAVARRVLMVLLDTLPNGQDECRRVLARLPEIAAPLLHWAERAAEAARDAYIHTIVRVAVWLATKKPDSLVSLFAVVLARTPTELPEGEAAEDHVRPVSILGLQLAVALAGDNRDRLMALFPATVTQTAADESYGYQDWLSEGIKLLERFPGITVPLAALFDTQPRRCLALLRQIGRATHLGSDVLAPLAECRFGQGATAQSDDPDWQAVLALAPALAPLVANLWAAQWLLGVPADVPGGIRRLVHESDTRTTELAYLESLCETKTPETAPGLFARRDSLRARLETDGFGGDSVLEEIRDRLRLAVAEAQMAATEQQAALCYRERLRQTVGALPPHFTLTPDLENATILSFTITENRKLLLKLLRARAFGEADPFENHPKNAAFRERLTASGADVTAWREAAPQRVVLPTRTLHLALETDPLHVLQMGNYFGTCLSAGSGCNAFSTVANAIEQNKRVVFARDGSGRVVARKLIGINEDNALVGFETYCSLSESEGAPAVRDAVKAYLTDFAARCRLPLADSGTVPTLFAESWYDDGTVAWNDAPEV